MFEIRGQDELTKGSDVIGLIAVGAQRCHSKDAGEGCLQQRTWVLESPLSYSLSVSLTVYSTSIKLSFFIWKSSTHQWFVGSHSMRSCLQTLSGNKGFHISPPCAYVCTLYPCLCSKRSTPQGESTFFAIFSFS